MLGARILTALVAIAPCGTTARKHPPSSELAVVDLGQLKSANPQPLLDRGLTVTEMSVVASFVNAGVWRVLWGGMLV
jgi:hypothetical protein